MKAIVMDTSNTYLVIALYENDKCIDKYQENGNKRQSEYALTYLNEMLTKNNIDMLDVEQMIITIGPGSYTGQRVALTIAKTLAAISKIKIKAVSSLHGYAGKNKAISVIDARSNKIFVGVYDNNHSIIYPNISPSSSKTRIDEKTFLPNSYSNASFSHGVLNSSCSNATTVSISGQTICLISIVF